MHHVNKQQCDIRVTQARNNIKMHRYHQSKTRVCMQLLYITYVVHRLLEFLRVVHDPHNIGHPVLGIAVVVPWSVAGILNREAGIRVW